MVNSRKLHSCLRARALAPHDPNVLIVWECVLRRSAEMMPRYRPTTRRSRSTLTGARPLQSRRSAEKLHDIRGSRAAYQRAVTLDRNYAEAFASIAWLDAQAGDAASARAYGEHAVVLSPSNVLAGMARPPPL
jgi:hypothetical protein